MIDWKRKLVSRKLWMAVIGLVTGILLYLGKSEEEANQIGALILSAASVVAYIIGEGMADAGNGVVTHEITVDAEVDEQAGGTDNA